MPRRSSSPRCTGRRRALTIDDVVIHTLGLFALLGAAAAVGWGIAPNNPGIGIAAGLAALALSFVIAFSRVIRPPLVVVFALLEGLAIGLISRFYEDAYHGIVLQALLGTGVIFIVMLGLYRSGRLRATPRMRKIVYSTLMGVVAIGLIDLVVRLTTGSHLPIINSSSPIGIIFSLAVLVVASLQFILDFDLHRAGHRRRRTAQRSVARLLRSARRLRLGLPGAAAPALQAA